MYLRWIFFCEESPKKMRVSLNPTVSIIKRPKFSQIIRKRGIFMYSGQKNVSEINAKRFYYGMPSLEEEYGTNAKELQYIANRISKRTANNTGCNESKINKETIVTSGNIQTHEQMAEWYEFAKLFDYRNRNVNGRGIEIGGGESKNEMAAQMVMESEEELQRLLHNISECETKSQAFSNYGYYSQAQEWEEAKKSFQKQLSEKSYFKQMENGCYLCCMYRYHPETKKNSIVMQYIHPGHKVEMTEGTVDRPPIAAQTVQGFHSSYSPDYMYNEEKIMQQFYLPVKKMIDSGQLQGFEDISFISVEDAPESFPESIDKAIMDYKYSTLTLAQIKEKAMMGAYNEDGNYGFSIKPSVSINGNQAFIKAKIANQSNELVPYMINKDGYINFIKDRLGITNLNEPNNNKQLFKNAPENLFHIIQRSSGLGSVITVADFDCYSENIDHQITQIVEMKKGFDNPDEYNANLQQYREIAKANGPTYIQDGSKNFFQQIYFENEMAKAIGAEYYLLYDQSTTNRNLTISQMQREQCSPEQIQSIKEQPWSPYYDQEYENTNNIKIFHEAYNQGITGQFAFKTYDTYSAKEIAAFGNIRTLIDYDIRSNNATEPLLVPCKMNQNYQINMAQILEHKNLPLGRYLNNDFLSKYPRIDTIGDGLIQGVDMVNRFDEKVCSMIQGSIYNYAQEYENNILTPEHLHLEKNDIICTMNFNASGALSESPVLQKSYGESLADRPFYFEKDKMQKLHTPKNDVPIQLEQVLNHLSIKGASYDTNNRNTSVMVSAEALNNIKDPYIRQIADYRPKNLLNWNVIKPSDINKYLTPEQIWKGLSYTYSQNGSQPSYSPGQSRMAAQIVNHQKNAVQAPQELTEPSQLQQRPANPFKL